MHRQLLQYLQDITLLKKRKSIYVTDLGEAVNEIMVNAFPTIVDTTFTANMETLLDGVEKKQSPWENSNRKFLS